MTILQFMSDSPVLKVSLALLAGHLITTCVKIIADALSVKKEPPT